MKSPRGMYAVHVIHAAPLDNWRRVYIVTSVRRTIQDDEMNGASEPTGTNAREGTNERSKNQSKQTKQRREHRSKTTARQTNAGGKNKKDKMERGKIKSRNAIKTKPRSKSEEQLTMKAKAREVGAREATQDT